MKEVSLRTILHTIGVSTAVGLYIWSDKLTTPIKDKNVEELSHEMAQNVGSIFVKPFKDALKQPYEIREMSFDIVWNLGLPCLLLLAALCILGYISKEMIQSFFYEDETRVDFVIKIILSVGLVLSTILVLINFGHLLFLNLIVAFVAIFIFALFIFGFGSIFTAKERTN
jgi:hypothetical protein